MIKLLFLNHLTYKQLKRSTRRPKCSINIPVTTEEEKGENTHRSVQPQLCRSTSSSQDIPGSRGTADTHITNTHRVNTHSQHVHTHTHTHTHSCSEPCGSSTVQVHLKPAYCTQHFLLEVWVSELLRPRPQTPNTHTRS